MSNTKPLMLSPASTISPTTESWAFRIKVTLFEGRRSPTVLINACLINLGRLNAYTIDRKEDDKSITGKQLGILNVIYLVQDIREFPKLLCLRSIYV